MVKGKLDNGFEYKVNTEEFEDDYEFFEKIAALENGKNPFAIISIIETILGTEQKNELIEHLKAKDEKGKARITEMEKCVTQIFGEIQKHNEKVKN